jgi:hypothetical protein
MAINLTVSLTDAEQAVVEAVAAKLVPNATPAQIKAWCERQAKAGLRSAVLTQRSLIDDAEATAARLAREAAALTGFPDPNGV